MSHSLIKHFFALFAAFSLVFTQISCSSSGIGSVTLTPSSYQTYPGGTVNLQSSVSASQTENLNYTWSCTGGNFVNSGSNNTWMAPPSTGNYQIKLVISNVKGDTAESSVTIAVEDNRPPVITSLTTDRDTLTYGGIVNLTCIASDPDGDAIRYSWTPSEGTVSGLGNKVTWTAPNKGGNYSVTVIVSDGKAETKQNVLIQVMSSTNTTTITMIKEESGTVSSSGDKDNMKLKAGDDAKNTGYRCFFSYDIFSLNNTVIKNARLKFSSVKVTGDPFPSTTGLGGIRFWLVKYGEGLPDFNIIGEQLHNAGGAMPNVPPEIDVTPEITSLVAAGLTRFQVEALFQKTSNGNNIAQMVEFSDATLEITFAPK